MVREEEEGKKKKKKNKKKKKKKSWNNVQAWAGLSLSPSLFRAEVSTIWDSSGNPPPCTFGSTIFLSSIITGRTANC